ncbi:TetR family transcriptional regulator [Marinobacter nauticus]|uniref:TetR family transcriptional regulator n=1 Tax=Marinobacter nauticus TaxID=2743 RepID=UPI0002F6D282|nr:TetR family transcriptional regulator [Marinobacter nauticus]
MKHRLCGGRQRARSDAEKFAREQHILDAAAELFVTKRFHELTLADVASASGLTKAALYRYFRSKELLFIAVYKRAFIELTEHARSGAPVRLPEEMTTLLVSHPLFCGLTAILHVALETGLTEQEAREFKLFLLEQSQLLVNLIRETTGKGPQACFHFLMQCQQALIGCWHMTHPPEAARKAMQQEPLTIFQMAFEPTLSAHLNALTQAFRQEGDD